MIRGGRFFSHSIIQLLKGFVSRGKRIRLSSCFHADLRWWISLSHWFNGTAAMINRRFRSGPVLMTDSSLTGYGLILGNDWQAGWYDSDLSPGDWNIDFDFHQHWSNIQVSLVCQRDYNINLLELIPVWQGILRIIRSVRDAHVLILSDNTQVVNNINLGKSSNTSCMCLLREIFWLCAFFNIHVTAKHVPGIDNNIADALSRITNEGLSSYVDHMSLCCSGV